jgi:VanZ family protein
LRPIDVWREPKRGRVNHSTPSPPVPLARRREGSSVRRFLRIALAVLATAALSFLLLTPDPLALLGFPAKSGPESVERLVSDKVQHAVSYAILTIALVVAFGRVDRRALAGAACLALAHGAATECLQQFVPDRTPDAGDLAANAAGIAAAVIVCRLCFLSPLFRTTSR